MANASTTERIQELLEEGLRALDAGELESAITAWNGVLALDPEHERAARLVADLEALLGQQERARELTGEVLVITEEDEDDEAPASGVPSVVSRRGLARMQSLVEKLGEENRALNQTLSARYAEVLELRTQLTASEKANLSLREKLADHERRAADVDIERADLARLRGLFEQQLSLLEFRVAEQQQQESTLRQQLVDVQAELERQRIALDTERSEHDATRSLVEETQVRVEETEARAAEAQARVEETEARAAEAQARVEEAEARAAEAQARVEEAEARAEAAATEAQASAQAEIAAVRDELGRRADAAAGEIAALRAELEHVRTARDEAEEKLNALAEQLNEALELAESRSSEVESLGAALNEAIELGEQHAATADRLQGELQAAQAAATTAQADALGASADAQELDTLRTQLEERDRAITSLTEAGMREAQQTLQLREQLAGAEKRAKAAEASASETEQLRQHIAALQAEIAAMADDIGARDLALEALENELRSRDQQLSELTQNLSRPRRSTGESSQLIAPAATAAAPPVPQVATPSDTDPTGEFSGAHLFASPDDDDAEPVTDSVVVGAMSIEDDLHQRSTGVRDNSELFDQVVTDPGRQAPATHAPDRMAGDAPQEDSLAERVTNFTGETAAVASESHSAPAHSDELPVFEMEPASYRQSGQRQAATSGGHRAAAAETAPSGTIHGMAFIAPEPVVTQTQPSGGRSKNEGTQLSMRSSSTARLADPNLSPAEQLSWLVDEIPRLTQAGTGMIRSKQIGAKEAFVVEAIDGSVSFSDIIDVVGLPAHETSAILVDLLRRGVITSPSVE